MVSGKKDFMGFRDDEGLRLSGSWLLVLEKFKAGDKAGKRKSLIKDAGNSSS